MASAHAGATHKNPKTLEVRSEGLMPNPEFSVIIATYNRADMLGTAVQSVLTQTYTDFELIIVDDGSKDGTRERVQGWSDPRIRYLYQENAGMPVARNNGFKASKGNFITFLDSDDKAISREWLKEMRAGFQNPAIRLVCCGCDRDYSRPSDRVVMPYNHGPVFNNITANFSCTGARAYRRDLFEEVGGFTPGLPSRHQTEFGLRLTAVLKGQEEVHIINKRLIKLCTHSEENMGGNLDKKYEGLRYVLDRHRDRFLVDPARYAQFCAVTGVTAYRTGRVEEARQLLLEAVRRDVTNLKHWLRLTATYLPFVAHRIWDTKKRRSLAQ